MGPNRFPDHHDLESRTPTEKNAHQTHTLILLESLVSKRLWSRFLHAHRTSSERMYRHCVEGLIRKNRPLCLEFDRNLERPAEFGGALNETSSQPSGCASYTWPVQSMWRVSMWELCARKQAARPSSL
jgi:hypothetical protein